MDSTPGLKPTTDVFPFRRSVMRRTSSLRTARRDCNRSTTNRGRPGVGGSRAVKRLRWNSSFRIRISACVLCWRLAKAAAASRLVVRPFLSGRDYHALHRENGAFRFDPVSESDAVTWKPYDTVPATIALSNGRYRHDPEWFRNFLYVQERERGLDCLEDLASPGIFSWPLGDEAVLIFTAEGHVERVKRFGATRRQDRARLA